MKLCSKCGVEQQEGAFYVRPNGRLHSWCIACMKALRVRRNPEIAVYQQNRRDRATAQDKRDGKNYQLRYNFGITLSEYEEMLEKQHYRCAVCEKQNGTDIHSRGRTKELSVDH